LSAIELNSTGMINVSALKTKRIGIYSEAIPAQSENSGHYVYG